MHLTARGRRVVFLVAVLLACAVGLAGGRAMASGPETGVPVDVYTVGSGETLWSIATGFTEPGSDVRDTVHRLRSLNELSSSALRAGQQILVPAASG